MRGALVLGGAALAFSAVGASAADLAVPPYGYGSAARLYNHAPPLHVAPTPRKPAPEVYVPAVSAAPYDAPAPAFTTPPTAPGYYIAQSSVPSQPIYDYGYNDTAPGYSAWVGAWIDGAMPFRASTIRNYLLARNTLYLGDPAVKTTIPAPAPPPDIEIRYKYNEDFESIYTMVPISISLLLALFPAILMALLMFLLKFRTTLY